MQLYVASYLQRKAIDTQLQIKVSNIYMPVDLEALQTIYPIRDLRVHGLC